MFKALFKMLLFALVPLLFLVLTDQYNPIKSLMKWVQEDYMKSIYLGSFQTIDNILSALPEAQREAEFNKIAAQFGAEIEFKTLSAVSGNEEILRRLRNGEIVLLEAEYGVVAYKMRKHDWVITAAADETDAQDTARLARGPIYLAKQDLSGLSPSEMLEKLSLLFPGTDFQFELKDSHAAKKMLQSLEAEGQRVYRYGDTIWYETEDNDEIFFVALDNSQTLLIQTKLNDSVGVLVLSLVAVAVFSFFAISLLGWLWPLWRDHMRLNKTAEAFGRGNLDKRVNINKGSMAANLGSSFNIMADNIQQLIGANQQLTNAVAHDLRTPLARLRFAVEMLNSGECSPDESNRYRHTIETSIDALDYLINQTLVHSRYNRSTDLKHFKEHQVSDHISEEVTQYDFDYVDIDFTVNIDHALLSSQQFVDVNALRRALVNLLCNAAKHANTQVCVSYFEQGNELSLQVEDDGEGISEQDVDSILRPYVQLGNKERDISNGLGLGLAIVHQITQWHKGEISVSRSSLGGASIKISWPRDLRQRDQKS